MRQLPRHRRRLASATAAVTGLVVLSGVAQPAPSIAAPSNAFPNRLLHPNAPYYQKLPRVTPVASDSRALVAGLVRQSETFYGSPGNPTINVNHDRYAPTMYVTRNSDPLVNFGTENCQGKAPGWDIELKANHLSRIRIPTHAVPDNSSDSAMALYNVDTDELTETWVTKKHSDGTWTACWGGTLRNASKSVTGAFTRPYGSAASGLTLSATMIRADELKRGQIDHAIHLAIPWVKARPAVSWPATRTDGRTEGTALTMGQVLRLPADLDINSLKLSPSARTIAKAAQEYGIIIGDSSGAVAFGAQNSASLTSNPYPDIFRGRWAMHEMLGDPARGEGRFPLDRLQALPVDYRVPVSVARPAPTPVPRHVLRRLDAGGAANNGWSADNGFTGGWKYSSNRSINVSREANPAPALVYRSERAGMFQHILSGLEPRRSYTVRLHFAEIWWTQPGSRRFHISANGNLILKNFDIVAAAGGPNTAVVRATTVVADSQGRILLNFSPIVDQASISGIELLTD